MSVKPPVVVAGHICLDIIPTLPMLSGGLSALLAPGKLVNVGPAIVATGGPVSNTGLALHKLGVPVRLMGKVGDDSFGSAVRQVVGGYDPVLAQGMIVASGENTSYTVVISPPGVDRIFLHCPGANDTFGADDIDYGSLEGSRLFHFGYPPLMHRMYADGGQELARLLRGARDKGLTVSLDMARADPDSPAGRADWQAILRRALPHVDLFLPSLDEILYILDRPKFQAIERGELAVDGPLVAEIAGRLLEMGPAIVAIKLGDQGLMLQTATDAGRLGQCGLAGPMPLTDWAGRQMLAPCFEVDVVGTTGSGDCTIAGFLAGLLKGLGPRDVLASAVAVGACNVEAADAVSGIRPWEQTRQRMADGWNRRSVRMNLPGWTLHEGVWYGPADRFRERQAT